jgi:hypothetical protein
MPLEKKFLSCGVSTEIELNINLFFPVLNRVKMNVVSFHCWSAESGQFFIHLMKGLIDIVNPRRVHLCIANKQQFIPYQKYKSAHVALSTNIMFLVCLSPVNDL